MAKGARIEFSQKLTDKTIDPKFWISQAGNPPNVKYVLNIQISLNASYVEDIDSPVTEIETICNCRDVLVDDSNIVTKGNADVELLKIDKVSGNSILVVRADLKSKIPGTGPSLQSI